MAHGDQRLARGREMMDRVSPKAAESVIRGFDEIAPDFGDLLQGFVFADIYGREVLSLRECQLIRLGALVALGVTGTPLRANIEAALHVGISKKHVIETFLQSLPYAGFPRVIEAIEVAREMFGSQPPETSSI